jgi:hypothetical protein
MRLHCTDGCDQERTCAPEPEAHRLTECRAGLIALRKHQTDDRVVFTRQAKASVEYATRKIEQMTKAGLPPADYVGAEPLTLLHLG